MKKYRRKVAFMLLAAVLTASGLLDLRAAQAKAAPLETEGKNIVLGKDVIASSVANGSGSELTVDGEKDQTHQCNSADMKNRAGSDTSRDQEEQIPPVDTD